MCEHEPNVTFLTLAMTFRMIKFDADAAADDGRVGIWKALLPGGTAELTNTKKWIYFASLGALSIWQNPRWCTSFYANRPDEAKV